VFFEVFPPKNAQEITAKSVAIVNGQRFEKDQYNINYEHIAKQQVLKPSEAQLIRLDIKTKAKKSPTLWAPAMKFQKVYAKWATMFRSSNPKNYQRKPGAF
jgi:hypothetical protein